MEMPDAAQADATAQRVRAQRAAPSNSVASFSSTFHADEDGSIRTWLLCPLYDPPA